MTDEEGEVIWQAEFNIFGKVRQETNRLELNGYTQNLRYQGQYFDVETGLHYNLHRYYDPDIGRFTTQDPIGLAGGMNLYQYAPNALGWVDPLGLVKTASKTLQVLWQKYTGNQHIFRDIHHGFPEQFAQKFYDLAGIDVNNPKYFYNLPLKKHTMKPGIHTNSSRSGQNWNKTWGGLIKQVELLGLSKTENKKIFESLLRSLARKERIGKYNGNASKNRSNCN